MLTKILKSNKHFVRCNKSYSCFEFEDNGNLYVIRIKKKWNIFRDTAIQWEYPENVIWDTPYWFRQLAKSVEDAFYEKNKEKYKDNQLKVSLNMVLFLYSIVQENVHEGYDMDDEFTVYLKGEDIIRKDIDYATWKKEWDASFSEFQDYLNRYGYAVKIIEENHYERYFEIHEAY